MLYAPGIISYNFGNRLISRNHSKNVFRDGHMCSWLDIPCDEYENPMAFNTPLDPMLLVRYPYMIKIIYKAESEFREHLYKFELSNDVLKAIGISYTEKNDIYKYFLELCEKYEKCNSLCRDNRHEYCSLYYREIKCPLEFCLKCGYICARHPKFYEHYKVIRQICNYEILEKSLDNYIKREELYTIQNITKEFFKNKEEYKLYVISKIYPSGLKSAIKLYNEIVKLINGEINELEYENCDVETILEIIYDNTEKIKRTNFVKMKKFQIVKSNFGKNILIGYVDYDCNVGFNRDDKCYNYVS